MNKFKNNKLTLILVLVLTIILVSGGTYAYFQWQSSLDDKSNVIVSVTDDIKMTINPAAVTKTGMRPTNNCGGNYGMNGLSIVTIENNTGVLARPRFKLKLKITDKDGNNITNETSPMGNPYRQYIKYAVSEIDGSCTSPLSSGRFNLNAETSTGSGWYESSTLTLNDSDGFPAISDGLNTGVSFDAFANRETIHTYKVWIWIDETYIAVSTGNTVTVDKLQDATITVSWSENSTVEQVHGDGVAPSIPELTGEAYAVYSADDNSLRFYRSETPIEVNSEYNNLTATAVYLGFEEDSYDYMETPWYEYSDSITTVVFEDEIVPISTAFWFGSLVNCSSIDVTKLNTSYVTNMMAMFELLGSSTEILNIFGINDWDTSNVTDMTMMFNVAGYNAINFSLDLSGWDTSKVTNMSYMFDSAGKNAINVSLDLSGWDTSNVTDMTMMFYDIGATSTTTSLQLSGWEFTKLENIVDIFSGDNATNLTLNLSNWNVNNIYLKYILLRIGMNVTGNLYLDLSNWDLRNTDVSGILYGMGYDATNIYLDLSGWQISTNTNINKISSFLGEGIEGFSGVGDGITGSWTLDVSDWNLSNVTDLSYMFYDAGGNLATTFSIIGINTWNVSNVTNMSYMFYGVGGKASTLSLDLSNWNTGKVTDMSYMFSLAGNNGTEISLNLSNWNTSNVTNMKSMFQGFIRPEQSNLTTYSITGLNNWDTRKVTDMEKMFYLAGDGATNTWSLSLSGWNICNVTNYSYFNAGVESKITPPNWDMECPSI